MARGRRVVASLVVLAALGLGTTSCNRYGFDGAIDSIAPATVIHKYGPYVEVIGWVRAATDTGWQVFGTIDGVVAQRYLGSGPPNSDAAIARPDVEAQLGGHAGSFGLAMSPPPRGVYRLCVHVLPLTVVVPAAGTLQRGVGDEVACGWLIQGKDWTDRGHIDDVSVSGGVVTVEGWLRFTDYSFASPSAATAGVLGSGQMRSATTREVIARPDVDAVYGPGTTGFRETYPFDPAIAEWCVASYEYNFDGTGVMRVVPFDCHAQPAA